MAINPLPRVSALDLPNYLPSAARAPEGTFNNIGSIGDPIGQYRTDQQLAEAIRAATDPQGNVDPQKAAAEIGRRGLPPRYAEVFTKQQALGQTERELTERGRHNLAIEDAARTAKVPFGWAPDPAAEGGYRPFGPADPAYQAKLAEGKQKPREFSATDINKLTEEGSKFGNVTSFNETFKDKYAGYISPAAGEVANYAGRFLPKSVVGEDVAEASSWWQNYDRWKNVVRHEQYGASLQPNETVLFEKADVNPGMQAPQIRENLKEQQRIVRGAATRKANALIAAGFDPAPIAAAYGLDLRQLGVDASGRRGTVAPAPTTSAPGGNIPPPPPGFIMR